MSLKWFWDSKALYYLTKIEPFTLPLSLQIYNLIPYKSSVWVLETSIGNGTSSEIYLKFYLSTDSIYVGTDISPKMI